MQQVLCETVEIVKRIRNKEPKKCKTEDILRAIRKNNSEIHIFRYKTLYNIYNKLYLYTYSKPLSNLNYYVEDDGFLIAEIKGSENKLLPERLKLHIDLLRKVKRHSKDLQYSNSSVVTSDNSQMTLFTL
jgi:hypothetical protein